MKSLIIIAALVLAGCATQPNSAFSKMTPEQLKAIHADKNITIICNSVSTLTADVVNVYAIIDKTTIPEGGLTISEKCSINFVTSAQ